MLWLVKWLLFRLMFASGVVKLTYMDKTWWNLTALNWHYESQVRWKRYGLLLMCTVHGESSACVAGGFVWRGCK